MMSEAKRAGVALCMGANVSVVNGRNYLYVTIPPGRCP